ncbi:MAG TPA: formylglycine-generating enzyme family protein [Steroidobacteraceae bacterium]|nr:formylglycine-generating enzyme family protein [Steroidobacteraceae bacterium]
MRITSQRTSLALPALIALIATSAVSAGAPDQHTVSSAGAQDDRTVHIEGGAFRSVLPTGTSRDFVTVKPYRLDRRPVTNAEFLAFVSEHPEWRKGRVPVALADVSYLQHWTGALQPGPTSLPNQPVTSVSWFAARAYCEARGARLPDWYEWELAAAADETQRDARNSAEWQQRVLSWYSRPSNVALARVNAGKPNAYGVYDLHGLVWEWVEDFNALLMSGDSREQGDPDLLKFCGSGALSLQDQSNYAVAMRVAFLSSLQAHDTTINLGFRCASN